VSMPFLMSAFTFNANLGVTDLNMAGNVGYTLNMAGNVGYLVGICIVPGIS
jgi:hypothetical protein